MPDIDRKYEELKAYFRELGSVGVTFSGGVDSTLVLQVAHEVLGERAVALTAASPIFPPYESDESQEFCRQSNIRHLLVEVDPFTLEGYADNPPNRCYICKKLLFEELLAVAEREGLAGVVDGTNADDTKLHRPGMKALEELAEERVASGKTPSLSSPLKELGFTKEEIRGLSRRIGLPTWDKATYACLMTRFGYGLHVTEKLLDKVGRAEQFLLDQGFKQVRVRYRKGEQVSVEVAPEEMDRLFEGDMAQRVDDALKNLGFTQVSVDPDGYVSGRMDAEA